MTDHYHSVGSFEAKTHLADLLRRAEAGERIIIKRRGKPIAMLTPIEDPRPQRDMKSILAEMERIRNSIEGPINIRELIEEGRKY
jgi:prevent-host-death family protein